MKIQIPNKFMGVPLEGALEKALAKAPVEVVPEVQQNQPLPSVNVAEPEKYIILEGRAHGSYAYPDLLVAMEKSHYNHNWNSAKSALHAKGEFMLTPRQFADFLKLLKSGDAYDGKGQKVDSTLTSSILDDIFSGS
jgi:hypothetical protein